MEIIQFDDVLGTQAAPPKPRHLANLSFVAHKVVTPPMSIWMMSLEAQSAVLPWWGYNGTIDEDLQRLNDLWSVSSPQSFFDCLFLSQFKRLIGRNLYMIAPGYLRTEGWDKLSDQARSAYLHGQSCVYRLEGALKQKLSINWVPFAQPQVIIKDPSFAALWSMFVASRNDDVANSIGFFQLADIKRLPEVTNMLIHPNDNRSVDLSQVVDWFGLYSSPLNPDHGACAVIYSGLNAAVPPLSEFQVKFRALLTEVRQMLQANPTPRTAFRILSRFVAI